MTTRAFARYLGWDVPLGGSAIAEVYPSLWRRNFAREGRTDDQHDAYRAAAWLRRADHDGSLAAFLAPCLTLSERAVADIEGWISREAPQLCRADMMWSYKIRPSGLLALLRPV